LNRQHICFDLYKQLYAGLAIRYRADIKKATPDGVANVQGVRGLSAITERIIGQLEMMLSESGN